LEEFYRKLSFRISKTITQSYSTSFFTATGFLKREARDAIYGIYGFVRFADEIVDTFHDYDKKALLDKFESDYHDALNAGISLNPVLHSFQHVVRKYRIPGEFVDSFLKSMRYDLQRTEYSSRSEMDDYIFGSADVVGLMCLKVFTDGDEELFEKLKEPAMSLGSAFQKVNFLRDIKTDTVNLNRKYFPEMVSGEFNEEIKNKIIQDIWDDFHSSCLGIRSLPDDSRLPVLIAYYYYSDLLRKISATPAKKLVAARIRISNLKKLVLIVKALVMNGLNRI